MLGATVADFFGSHGIFLIFVCQLCMVGSLDVCYRRGAGVKAMLALIETHVAETKGGASSARFVGGRCLHVLPRAAEEEKPEEGHVARGQCPGGAQPLGRLISVDEHGEGDGLDASWLGVGLSEAFEEAGEPDVDAPLSCEPAIRGPQHGHLLADGAEYVLHRASPDRLTSFGQLPVAVAMGKDEEVGDGIGNSGEQGVDAVLSAVLRPERP
jgi:hypothetical protein